LITWSGQTLLPLGAAESDKAFSPKGRFASQNPGHSPHVGRIFILPRKEKLIVQSVQFVLSGFGVDFFELFVDFADLGAVAPDLQNGYTRSLRSFFASES